MQYKITEQFARGEEKAIAEFYDLYDSRIFLAQKIADADLEKQKIIFRVYDDSELVHESNRAHISISYAKYAEGNGDLALAQLPIHLMIQSTPSTQKINIANFHIRNDAYLFATQKCELDDRIKDNTLFFIYQEKNLIDTVSKTVIINRKKEAARYTRNENKAVFHPTPLSIRPKPPGGPSYCWIEEDDEN